MISTTLTTCMLEGESMNIKEQTIQLIDNLKATCQVYGLGNDGNEYKIITQVFLFKFLNDKFGVEVKKISERLRNVSKWEEEYRKMTEDERLDLFDQLSPDIPRLNPEHLISNLWNQQSKGDFDVIFDSTMTDIADKNKEIFSTETTEKKKIALFEKITTNVTDDAQELLLHGLWWINLSIFLLMKHLMNIMIFLQLYLSI